MDGKKYSQDVGMAVNRGVGLGALFLFFVLAVALLPLIRKFTFGNMEGYTQEYADAGLGGNTAAGLGGNTAAGPSGPGDSVKVTPDVNIDPTLGYDSRTRDTALPCNVDASGKVCPEGTFCDGSTRSCIQINAATIRQGSDIVGYYS